MFKRLYVDNYKCLVNFELQLQDLSLLLGPNGSGKTSVLDVVFALRRFLSGEAKVTDRDVFPSRSLTRWDDRDLQTFEAELVLESETFVYRLEVEHERTHGSKTRRAKVVTERLTGNGKPLFECTEGEVQLYRDDHTRGPRYSVDWSESALARVAPRSDNTRLTNFLAFVKKVLVCGIYPASFEPESAGRDPILARDASNFASWYQHLVLERQDLVHEFTTELGKVVDGFKAINLPPVGEDTVAMKILFAEDDHRYQLGLDEVSDGQRALMALYALVYLAAGQGYTGQGYTLFLDEPDNYVALAEIQPWLMALEDACGETVPQAVLCSHHPELIDYLGPDRGLSLQRERGGVITVRRLADQTVDAGLKLSELVARGWER